MFVWALFRNKKGFTENLQTLVTGGERGIRTLDTFKGYTRFPVVRLRPAQPSLHNIEFKIAQVL